jgi:hypothetical protein
MAGVTGLEPAASGVTGRRSNQLSYTPLKALIFWSVCSMVFAVSNPKNTKNTHHIAKILWISRFDMLRGPTCLIGQ